MSPFDAGTLAHAGKWAFPSFVGLWGIYTPEVEELWHTERIFLTRKRVWCCAFFLWTLILLELKNSKQTFILRQYGIGWIYITTVTFTNTFINEILFTLYRCCMSFLCLLLVYDFYLCLYVCRFQNVVLRCSTPRLHCFLSSHWPSFRFLSSMAFLILSIQFFFDLPRALFCFGIHFNAILGNLPSAILWTWPYHLLLIQNVIFFF